MRRDLWLLAAILLVTLAALGVIWPTGPGIAIGGFERRAMRLGLDLQGGTYIVLEADLSRVTEGERAGALEGVRRIIERRINTYGVSEATVAQQGADRISVQLPGVRDIREAKELVGRTAQLDFRERKKQEGTETAEWTPSLAMGSASRLKHLTGAYLKPVSQVRIDPATGQPEVLFEWNAEGARLFKTITERNLNQPLGIFLDDALISAPTVQAVIAERGVITGLSLEEARILAIQLNAGALPVPVVTIQEQDVDATLGADSIRKSVLAGEIALGVVLLFMLLYYRLPGASAGAALLIYADLLLALFKLIPVTLTMAGIAAFILSIGMAVDANILIFERMKEELRRGRTLRAALETGFDRAWTAIRDSNVATLITCAVLYWFGSNFAAPLVQGFALTLGIGVALSMFTAIVISRTLLRLVLRTRLARQGALFIS